MELQIRGVSRTYANCVTVVGRALVAASQNQVVYSD